MRIKGGIKVRCSTFSGDRGRQALLTLEFPPISLHQMPGYKVIVEGVMLKSYNVTTGAAMQFTNSPPFLKLVMCVPEYCGC